MYQYSNILERIRAEVPEKEIPPIIHYILEDKDKYPYVSSCVNPKTGREFIDIDNDFLLGESGGVLMNMSFVFINTDQFCEGADRFEKTGRYCPHETGTLAYRLFWEEEGLRRRVGMTIPHGKLLHKDIDLYNSLTDPLAKTLLLRPLRITGDHYNFLNYGRILRSLTRDEREEFNRRGFSKIKEKEGFPRFWDGHYWNFKVDEFVVNNEYNLAKGKCRRRGYSYQRASQGANTINANPKITILLAAYDKAYLTDAGATTDMLKKNLDWYENNTYWHRGYISENLDNIELGYKKSSEGHKKYGWLSKCISVSAFNNPRCAVGKGAVEIDAEEAGVFPNLQEFLNVTLSAVETGMTARGTVRVYGTGGTKDADWKDFANVFYTPAANGMLPMENVCDVNSRRSVCGFFHPQVLNLEPYMDEWGNSMLAEATIMDYKDKLEKAKSLSISDWVIYVGQRANSPSEAFRRGRENIFTSPHLDAHVTNVRFNDEYKYYRDGMPVLEGEGNVVFKTNAQIVAGGGIAHPYIEDVPIDVRKDVYGCVREYYPPFRNANGEIPDDLYYITFDPVDKDKDRKEFNTQMSINSMHVLMYPNTLTPVPGDIIVAAYAGRSEMVEDSSRIALHLAMLYNAKIIAEVDRGQIVSDFKMWGKLHYLHKDPLFYIDRNAKKRGNPNYGINIGSGERKPDGLIYLKDWMYTPISIDEDGNKKYIFHYIKDLPTLLEFQNFTINGNFDRISSLIVGMYQRKAYRTKRQDAKDSHSEQSIFAEIGLYRNNR